MTELQNAPNDNDNVKVFVRLRPGESQRRICATVTSTTTLSVQIKLLTTSSYLAHNNNNNGLLPAPSDVPMQQRTFTFDYVAKEDVSQQTIFEKIGKPMADACLAGYHGCIFAYGQTGSGKTYTIYGGISRTAGDLICEERGLIPHILEYLFSQIALHRQRSPDIEYLCKCNYLEIYQENITDLLSSETDPPKLHIREDLKQGVYVEQLLEVPLTSAEDAMNLLVYGSRRRHISPTAANDQSSRSHAVFTLHIQSKETKEGGITALKHARLHLVDLAGSERQKSTEATGYRLKEASNINQSLTTLGQVIRSLASEKKSFVHYRNSKLTFLLKDSLGGNSKTSIIATIDPSIKSYGELLSTLKFAQRAKLIKNKAVINEDSSGSILDLQDEIRRLKERIRTIAAAETNSATTSQVASASFDSSSDERIIEMETLLKYSLEREERTAIDRNNCFAKIEDLQQLCLRKDFFLHASRLIIRLYESKIQRLLGPDSNISQEGDMQPHEIEIKELKENIELLKYQVDHHPELVRFSIENLELRELLDQYEEFYSNENGELARLRKMSDQLNAQVQKLISDKHKLLEILEHINDSKVNDHSYQEENACVDKDAAQSKSKAISTQLEQWKHEQAMEVLMAQLDAYKLTVLEERRELHRREIELEEELRTTTVQVRELEGQLKQNQFLHRSEIDALQKSHIKEVNDIQSTYEGQLGELRQGVESTKLTCVTVLTMERQMSQLMDENHQLSSRLEEQDADARELKRALNQLQGENQRMSQAFTKQDRTRFLTNQDPNFFTRNAARNSLSNSPFIGTYQGTTLGNNTPSTPKVMQGNSSIASLAVAQLQLLQQDVIEYKEQVEKLQSSVLESTTNYENKIGTLTAQLEESSKNICSLHEQEASIREEYEITQNELNLTRQMLEESEEFQRKSEASLVELSQKFEKMGQEKAQLKVAMDTLAIQLKSQADEQVSSLLQEKEKIELELVSQKTLLDQELIKNKTLQMSLDVSRVKIGQFEYLVNDKTEELLHIKTHAQKTESRVRTLESQLEELVDELGNARIRLQELEKVAEFVQDLEDQKEEITLQLKETFRKMLESEQDCKMITAEIEQVKVESFERQDELLREYGKLQKEHDELGELHEDLKTRFNYIIEHGSEEQKALQTEHIALAENLEQMTGEFEQVKKSRCKLEEQLFDADLKRIKMEYLCETQRQQLKIIQEDMKSMAEKHEMALMEKNSAIEELQQQFSEVQLALDNAMEMIRINQLEYNHNAANLEFEFKHRSNMFQGELDSSHQQLIQLKKENAELRLEVEKLHSQIEHQRAQVQSLEKQYLPNVNGTADANHTLAFANHLDISEDSIAHCLSKNISSNESSLQSQLSQMEQALKSQSANWEKIDGQKNIKINQLESKLGGSISEYNRLMREYNQLIELNSSIKQKLHAYDEEAKALKIKNINLEEHLANVTDHNNLKAKIKFHHALKSENNELRAQISNLKDHICNRDRSIRELKASIANNRPVVDLANPMAPNKMNH